MKENGLGGTDYCVDSAEVERASKREGKHKTPECRE